MQEKDYFNVLTEEYQKGIDIVLSYLLEEVEKINNIIDECDDRDLIKKYKEKKILIIKVILYFENKIEEGEND